MRKLLKNRFLLTSEERSYSCRPFPHLRRASDYNSKVEETEQQDPYEKTITRIFKEYGERMAGMEHAVTYLQTVIM